jgi:quinol monooxygenase YgiN
MWLLRRARNPAAWRSLPIVRPASRVCFTFHSRWTDEAAFETHAGLPHTVRFVERMQPLIDHPFEATRATPIG